MAAAARGAAAALAVPPVAQPWRSARSGTSRKSDGVARVARREVVMSISGK
jgi:hypothetical protein